jgi:hypothetical protein
VLCVCRMCCLLGWLHMLCRSCLSLGALLHSILHVPLTALWIPVLHAACMSKLDLALSQACLVTWGFGYDFR